MYYAAIGAFFCGVAVRTFYAITLPALVWVGMLAFVVALLARRNSEAISARQLTTISLALLCFVIGATRTEIHVEQFNISPLQQYVGQELLIEGEVVSEPDIRNRTVQLEVLSEGNKLLVSTDRLLKVSYGDSVLVSGKIEEPESFETELGRVFHYDNSLRAKGIEYRISFADVEVLESGNGNFLISVLLSVKHKLMSGIEKVLPEPQAGLGEGLLLGVKQALGDSLEQDFRTTGIIHIVVLSGYNIMLVVAFVMYVLGYFLRSKTKIFAGLMAIAAFALIVGLSATVVRASIMAGLLLVAQAYGKNYNVLRALFFAGAVMVFINPLILMYDIGFQLSFMATLGLILIAPKFETMLAQVPNKIGVREFLLATIATQLAVLPLLLYHIGEVSLVAVIVNVLVLPVVPVAMFTTFVAGVLALVVPVLGSMVAFVAYLCLSYIIFIAEFFALLPFASITVPAFSPWLILGMYALPTAIYLRFICTQKKKEELTDWEVVEEVSLLKGAGPKGPAPTEESSPVFFR